MKCPDGADPDSPSALLEETDIVADTAGFDPTVTSEEVVVNTWVHYEW